MLITTRTERSHDHRLHLQKHLVVAPKDESIVDAAKRMRLLHVGTVIVVEERGGTQAPLGILTDRDIVLSIVASDAKHLPFSASATR